MVYWLLLAVAEAATPLAGVRFTPFSRADLVWVDEERTSGTAVGEWDGIVRPSLSAFAGAWFGERFALTGGLGVARLTSTTWSGEVWRQRHWGVARPSIEARIGLGARRLRRPVPFVLLGVHGDIPSARDTSNGYTQAEQDAADENAYAERVRLGGLGGRLGAGVDFRVVDGLAVGASYAIEGHWGVLRSDDLSTVSSWIASETAFLLLFEWPDRPRRRGAAAPLAPEEAPPRY
jgi:hypothetical protein